MNNIYKKIWLFLNLDHELLENCSFQNIIFPYTKAIHFENDIIFRDENIQYFHSTFLNIEPDRVCTNDFHKSLIVNYIYQFHNEEIDWDSVKKLSIDVSLLFTNIKHVTENLYNDKLIFYDINFVKKSHDITKNRFPAKDNKSKILEHFNLLKIIKQNHEINLLGLYIINNVQADRNAITLQNKFCSTPILNCKRYA